MLAAEPVYRSGRETAIAALDLRPGERVLDVGCGTGLNLRRLAEAVGPTGSVTGLDLSERMLEVAGRTVRRKALPQVRLVAGDAMTAEALGRAGESGRFDAVIATYSLSLMPDVAAAWDAARGVLAPQARVSVVDMAPPSGRARMLSRPARLACWLGGADIDAHPWTTVERDLTDVRGWSLRGGHVQVRVGQLAEVR